MVTNKKNSSLKIMQKWTGDYIFMRIEEMFLTAAEDILSFKMMTKARLMLNSLMQLLMSDYTCKKNRNGISKLTSG